jgi:hypothetical protein
MRRRLGERRRSKFPAEGVVTRIRGRNGACDVALTVTIPHGKRSRDIEVALQPEFILALAKAIDCCPEHILETHRTGKRGPGPEATYVNLGHAVWHLENPGMPRPCLPTHGQIIDVMDETKLTDGDGDITAHAKGDSRE